MIAQDLQILEAWLDQPWPNGVIAAGGCSAENQAFSRVLSSDNSLRLSPEFWLTMNEAMAQLAAYGCGNGRLVWFFETAVLQIVARDDGAWAGAIVPREVAGGIQTAVQARLREFVSMVE